MNRRDVFAIIDESAELTKKSMELLTEMVGSEEVVTISRGELEQYLKNIIYHILMQERGYFRGSRT